MEYMCVNEGEDNGEESMQGLKVANSEEFIYLFQLFLVKSVDKS